MIPTPDEVGANPSSIAGWIGAGIAAVVAAALGLRRWLSGDAAARAENSVNIDFMNTLMDQVKAAQDRAERAERERNEAVAQIGELKAQIATLQLTVNHMQAQIDKMVCA